MNSGPTSPAVELEQTAREGLLRQLRPLEHRGATRILHEDRELWNFSSNDYLGLAVHPEVSSVFIEGVRRFGAGAGASRLVTGTLPPHLLLEEELAAAKQTEASLVFPSGYATAVGVIPVIAGKGDFIVADRLIHASLIDAARLAGATLRIFPHNDAEKAAHVIANLRARHSTARILIVTESVFSMDGDLCPLAALCAIAEENNALLLVDEAHGFGILGSTGMGLAEQLGLQKRITFQMGTLSKAAGLSGGYIAASREWIDLFINRSRSFIYTTAPPPALAHAARASLRLIRSNEGHQLREKLRANIALLSSRSPSAIIPLIRGSNEAALAAAAYLEKNGILAPAIRYPTVPSGTARLRITVSAAHPPEAIHSLIEMVASIPNDESH